MNAEDRQALRIIADELEQAGSDSAVVLREIADRSTTKHTPQWDTCPICQSVDKTITVPVEGDRTVVCDRCGHEETSVTEFAAYEESDFTQLVLQNPY